MRSATPRRSRSRCHRLPADHDRADHRRRDRPEAVRDPACRGRGAADRAAAAVLPGRCFTRSSSCSAPPRTRCCGCSAPTRTPSPRAARPDELKRIIAESQTGGQLDVGEASMLTGRLPPARAGGAAGDDADSRGRHRRCGRDRRRRRCSAASRPGTRAWSSPRTRTRTASRGSSTSTSSSSC